jgi:hypothetical protein
MFRHEVQVQLTINKLCVYNSIHAHGDKVFAFDLKLNSRIAITATS